MPLKKVHTAPLVSTDSYQIKLDKKFSHPDIVSGAYLHPKLKWPVKKVTILQSRLDVILRGKKSCSVGQLLLGLAVSETMTGLARRGT